MMARLDRLGDADLLARTRRQPEAFGIFYERHVRMVTGFLVRSTADTDRALDLTAEVFAAALAGASRFKREGPPASAWLLGIARNKLADERRGVGLAFAARRKLGIPRIDFDDVEIERVEEILDAERAGYVSALMKLPEPERDAVRARVLEGRSYAEIAASHRTSQAAIRQRVSRGLAKLARPTRGEAQ